MTDDPASLDRLHDIIVPEPVPWWPPATGWIVVLGILAIVLVVVVVRLLIRWQKDAYRREALRELASIEENLSNHERQFESIAALGLLLKRAALTAWPRNEVASLSGERWLKFLDQSGDTMEFSAGPGTALARASFDSTLAPLSPNQQNELTRICRDWLRHHRPGGPAC